VKYDKFAMAQMNRSMVFDLIRRKGPISRAEIARTIGLSIPTVMKITEEFSHKQFVQDVGKGESSGGKRPELLELVPDCANNTGSSTINSIPFTSPMC